MTSLSDIKEVGEKPRPLCMKLFRLIFYFRGYFSSDSVSRRGRDLTVGADENGGSDEKDPRMLIKELPSLLAFVNKSKQLHLYNCSD